LLSAPAGPGNTAEPSGELTVADLVVVGETPLIVDRAGWVPLRGGITEVRLDEHGTHPLPLRTGSPEHDKETTAHEPQG
jgi:hypothetical protein